MLTIAPPPRAFRCGSAAFVVTNVVRRFCERVFVPPLRRHLGAEAAGRLRHVRIGGPAADAGVVHDDVEPAEALGDPLHGLGCVGLDRDVARSAIPGTGSADAVFSASVPSRSRMATRAPCAAITRAMPAPMPRAPPVTSASLPAASRGYPALPPMKPVAVTSTCCCGVASARTSTSVEVGKSPVKNSLRAFHTSSRCLMSVT